MTTAAITLAVNDHFCWVNRHAPRWGCGKESQVDAERRRETLVLYDRDQVWFGQREKCILIESTIIRLSLCVLDSDSVIVQQKRGA